jgi:hypothetical protein
MLQVFYVDVAKVDRDIAMLRVFHTHVASVLSRVAEPGQKVPDVKKKFAHHGIRSQDLLPSAWFPYQLT